MNAEDFVLGDVACLKGDNIKGSCLLSNRASANAAFTGGIKEGLCE